MSIGRVLLVFDDLTERTLERVRVRPRPVTYDATPYRPPYSDTWRASGTITRGTEEFTFETEVTANSIQEAAPLVRTLVEDMNRAIRIHVPFGIIHGGGVLTYSVQPSPLGYRVHVVVGGPRAFTPTTVMYGADTVVYGASEVVHGYS